MASDHTWPTSEYDECNDDDDIKERGCESGVPEIDLDQGPSNEEEGVSCLPDVEGEEVGPRVSSSSLSNDLKGQRSPLRCDRYRHLSTSSWTSNSSGGSEDSSSSAASSFYHGPVSWMPPHLHRDVSIPFE